MAEERKKVWIDPFQTRLTLRIAAYLFVFLFVFCNLLFAWKMWSEGPIDPAGQFIATLKENAPAFILLVVLVPVMAWDTIKFSHRLVGPLVRFRQTIQAIARGEAVRPVKLREGDHLTEMRDEFNHMLEELQKQGVPVLKPSDPGSVEQSKKTA
jgi:methyl-accepting chemotaxis protein